MFSYIYKLFFNEQIKPKIITDYNGELIDNKKNGKGELTIKNINIVDGKEVEEIIEYYRGNFKDNMKHGEGYHKKDNFIYQGFFKEDKRSGYGWLEIKYTDDFGTHQETYEGLFYNNLRHGKGKLTSKLVDNSFKTINEIYVGQFVADEKNGSGELITENNILRGIWINNKYINLN